MVFSYVMWIYTITINALLVILVPVVANHDKLFVPLGESITLSCSHEDADIIVWTFNNKVLYADSINPIDIGFANVNFYSNNSYNSYLYIEEIRGKNAGEYICLINDAIRREIYVNVIDADDNTRWVLFGESITLSCSNENDNVQPAVWKFNDRTLYASSTYINPAELGFENVKGYNNSNGGSFLHIEDIRCNNAGMYTCIIKSAMRIVFHINVAAIPQLTIQANHEVIDEVHFVENGEQIELECMALNSTINISLFWTIETNSSLYIKQQETRAVQSQETLMDHHTELHFIANEDANITCSLKHDLLQNYTNNLTISVIITSNMNNFDVVSPTRNLFSDMNYILVLSGVAVIALVCIITIILCVVRCKKKKKKSESSTSPGYKRNSQELDDYDGGRRETFMIEKISGRCEGGRISRDEVEVITCLSSGKVFEYWKAVCDGHSENEYIIARKITENAQMKDDYNFISIAKSLQELDEHPNIVNFLGCAIEKVPHFTYHEYVENVTLRDILLQNGNPPNDSLYSSTDKRDSVKLPHLIGFGRDIADGLAFLHTNKLCHPALMTRKILVDKRSCCKLFDIWPTDISSARLAKLKSDENPPTAWFPPESIFMDQYDSLSDVWSFGVLLWEMFSNGEVPYQYQGVKEVEDHIRQLDILPQRTDCPNKIFRIMTSTWNKVRESRPTMSKIKGQLKDIEKNALQTEQKNTIASNNYFTLESFGADYALPIKPNAIQEE
ncbi:uncharacterized protein [Apostichopus japonicus]|uniref:uncharacterized protein isoform X2 n=1 Tax=Stichopus japonicus TaxID=307972 RepID=UPI003AB872B0